MSHWADARRILCVRLDNMGDVLMTTPAMRALKAAGPDRHLTLLASPSGAAVAAHIPELDHVITYDAPWVKHGHAPDAAADRRMISRLAAGRFDAAVIFTVYSQSALPAALLCRMADIPLCLAHSRENPYLLLSDWVRETEPENDVRHEVQRQLDLVATVLPEIQPGIQSVASMQDVHLSFAVREADRASLHAKIRRHGVDPGKPWLTLHPGATAPSRRYPAELYAQAARAIHAELGCTVLISGSADESALCRSLQHAIGAAAHSLAGELKLGELGALVAESGVLLANNSGPVHIAAAVGTPVVDMYALTNPQHTPWQVPSRVLFHDVPCRNCYKSVCPQGHHACLAKVEPQEVVAAVCTLWREYSGAGDKEKCGLADVGAA